MKLTVISPMNNEEYILPFYFRHYSFVDEFIVFDNQSTDKTAEILKSHPKVKYHTYDTGGLVDDMFLLHVKNDTHKTVNSDWFIVVDADEFIWHHDLRAYLKNCLNNGVTFPRVCGYEMLAEDRPVDDGKTPLTDIVKFGVENRLLWSKRAVFHHTVSPNYLPGAHECRPSGMVVESPTEEIKLLHYKWLGYDRCMNKMRDRAKKMSPMNKVCGWGWQTSQLVDERWKSEWNLMQLKKKQVLS